MKKTFFAFLLFSFLFLVSANAGNYSILTSNTHPDPTDTVPYTLEELTSLNDTISSSPAFDVYSDWDTENIHFTKFNL